MPNKQPKNKPTPGDLLGNKAARLGVSLNDGRAECLCYVYALVLKDIGNILGATEKEEDNLVLNSPENKEIIQNIIKTLEKIHLKFSFFKENSKIRENCPVYSDFIYSDINFLITKLKSVIPPLKDMERVYDITKLDPLEHPEHFNTILDASNRYESDLLECRTSIIAINTRIKWWHEKLSPQGCQDQEAVG